MAYYDKDEIKSKLDTDMVFDIVNDLGGEPRRTDFGFICATICHNHVGEGSHKLYYYENTTLFHCYTGCADQTFDIFELITKSNRDIILPNGKPWGLYDSVRWVAARYGWGATIEPGFDKLPDWSIFEKYSKIKEMDINPLQTLPPQLKEYDSEVLIHMPHPIVDDWINEGITQEVMQYNGIGFYPPTDQIVIPHYDIDNRLIGIRGRALGRQEAELYGKYRPLMIGLDMYNHSLGLNLYNINNSAKNIKKLKTAVIFEGEKSCLLYQSYFGHNADISVACCGSAISSFQMSLLLSLDVQEVIIGFDKQFKEKGDDEFKRLVRNLRGIHARWGNYIKISFLFDKEDILPYKASPIDCGKDTFLYLVNKRILL